MRRLQLTLCAALLLTCLSCGAAAAEGVGLFSADAGTTPLRPPARRLFAEDAGSVGGPHGNGFPELPTPRELRSRSARIDIDRLSAARSEVAQGRPHHLRLNLFADAGFDALIERTAPTASGYTLTGRLADEPLSMVVVAVNGGHVAGTVWSSRGIHSIRARGTAAAVRQLDPSVEGRCGARDASPEEKPLSPSLGPNSITREPLSVDPPKTNAAALNVAPQMDSAHPLDDGSTIDVLVVYPAEVRRVEGGHRAMRALLDRDIAMTNEAYRTSGAKQRITLVAATEIDLPPLTVNSRRNNVVIKLASKSDGYLDEVHALRDSYAADLVTLHIGSVLRFIPFLSEWPVPLTRDNMPAGWETAAFNAPTSIDWSNYVGVGSNLVLLDEPVFSVSSSIGFGLAHHLGHNMGLHHERGDYYIYGRPDSSLRPLLPALHPYSHGYQVPDPSAQWGKRGTIMALGQALPRFSNPRQRYQDDSGVPLGVPGEEWTTSADGPADAVRTLNNTRRLVANYRASAARCTYRLSPPPPDVPASGGEYRISVEAPRGCAWAARGDGDGVAIVMAGDSGNGPGEVKYRVLANEGLEREAAVLVAGEVYSVHQTAGRKMKSVCEREPAVRQAIVAQVGKNCEEIVVADLANIRYLHLNGAGLTTLQPGAFDGLRGLFRLWLHDNNLVKLGPNTFVGLSNLAHLYLYGNNLTTLDPDAFAGLANLRTLDLRGNRLTTKPGMFAGLAKLNHLRLGENDIASLDRRAFEGLPSLLTLGLEENGLLPLQPGSFKELSNLEDLGLEENGLRTLQPGVFEGLSKLVYLRLEGNELRTLQPGVFDGVRKLGVLFLGDNKLATLESGAFEGLVGLATLLLENNQLAELRPGMFRGLRSLQHLILDRNGIVALDPEVFDDVGRTLQGLYLRDNRLTDLKGGEFGRLPSLVVLALEGNSLVDLDRRAFGGNVPALEDLRLSRNGLRSVTPGLLDLLRQFQLPGGNLLIHLWLAANQLESLPAGLFEGLTFLLQVDLRRNPGAPFTLRADLVAWPTAGTGSDRPNAVVAEVAEGTPFDIKVRLSSVDAVLSASEVVIPRGSTRSEPVSFASSGATPVKIRLSLAHEEEIDECDEVQWNTFGTICYGGLRAGVGPPLVLYGLPDQTLAENDTVRFDLRSAFPGLPNGTAYAAESNNPAVAEVAISGGVLTVIAIDSGVTTLTVTATGDGGKHEARRFTITVEQPVNSYWGGWRSVLLRPPPAADGNES